MLLASNYDQSRFFRADDFPENWEKKLRIKEVTEELVGEQKEPKLVVWFDNDKRGLMLNKTNNRTLRRAFGDDVDGWKSKIITLFLTETGFKGKPVPALRIRLLTPKTADAGNGQHMPAKPTSTQETLNQFAPPAAAAKPALPPIEDDMDDELPW